jgi:hypothetical protein
MKKWVAVIVIIIFISPLKVEASYVSVTYAFIPTGEFSIAVPAGVQADDIVILVCTVDYLAHVYTGFWPAGFTQLYDSDLTLDGQSIGIAWKRLTGADSGSYTFGAVGNQYVCMATAFRGRDTGNPPVGVETLNNDSNVNPVSIIAPTITALQCDDLLWVSAPDVTNGLSGDGTTPPTNYTEREDFENAWSYLPVATRENVSAGATGAITGTFALTDSAAGWGAYQIRIPASSCSSSSLLRHKVRGKVNIRGKVKYR